MSGLQPYRGPWERLQAAHLLRRAGFSPAPGEVDAALRDGLDATVERLLTAADESAAYREFDQQGEAIAARGGIQRLAAWWMARLRDTHNPLAARLALMWHNHFATSNDKVDSPSIMLQQLRTIEQHALGSFGELLLAMSRDPAMIIWLDGDQNRRGRPNENYARELFELFGLGVGAYTEQDIREAARAFSGWHQRGGRFVFREVEHDRGAKTIFGQTGRFGGQDVVELVLKHEACARWIARRLLGAIVEPDPSDGLVEALAATLREGQYALRPTLRVLLRSAAMFDPRCHRALIKSPVCFVTGLARSWDMHAAPQKLATAAAQMGQRLLEPPSVKGWDGQRRWIQSAAMLVRMNVAARAARGESGQGLDAAAWVQRAGLRNGADALRLAQEIMLDAAPPAELEAALAPRVAAVDAAEALRLCVAAIGASPYYQLQ